MRKVIPLAGLAVLLAYAWYEYLTRPGISLVDGYWIGRVPWTPMGVVLVLAGTALGVVGGCAVIVVRGDWLRRVLVPAIVGVPAFARWLAGPSCRITCPIWNSRRRRMRTGPSARLSASAVMLAPAVRNVM